MAEANAEKLKALQLTMDRLEKSYGKGTIMKLGDAPVLDIDVIPTGSLNLDLALGIKGYPRGRVVEIYGPESSGKTTLTIHAIAECQKQGGICAFIDAEHAFDPTYAESLGVDAIAAIPPIYFKLPEYGIAKYWNDMSAAAPNTDFVIYNIPQLAGVSLTMSLLKEMMKNPRVIGVKN